MSATKSIWPHILLVGAVCSAVVAVAQIPAFFQALGELGNVLSGQTDSYGAGHAIGAFLRAVSRLCAPYVLWAYRQKVLRKQVA